MARAPGPQRPQRRALGVTRRLRRSGCTPSQYAVLMYPTLLPCPPERARDKAAGTGTAAVARGMFRRLCLARSGIGRAPSHPITPRPAANSTASTCCRAASLVRPEQGTCSRDESGSQQTSRSVVVARACVCVCACCLAVPHRFVSFPFLLFNPSPPFPPPSPVYTPCSPSVNQGRRPA